MISIEYLAGLVDGEGHIRLTTSNKGKYRKLYPRLQVTNTYKPIIEELQVQYGGGIRHSVHKNKPHWKDKYDWVLDGDKARNMLEELIPYLKIKRRNAMDVLIGDQKA